MNIQALTQIFASDDFNAKVASLYEIAALMFDHLQQYKWGKRYSDQRKAMIDDAMVLLTERLSQFDPNKAELAFNYFTTCALCFYQCAMRLPPKECDQDIGI